MIMQAFSRLIVNMVLLAPTGALAQGVVHHDDLRAGFSRWSDVNETTGVLATGGITSDGTWQVQHTGAQAVELASVGKSITAVCVKHLVDEGRLEWSDSLPAHLDTETDVTIAELVTHSSGLGPDDTQTAMPLWLDQGSDPDVHFGKQVLDFVNARGNQTAQRGRYHYNNENYALLGLVIEAVTDRPYFEACAGFLDLPETIQPSPHSFTFQPWGGLVADATGYLAFLHEHFGPGSDLGDDPFAYPHVDMGGGAYYGLGMVFRRFRESYNFWHFGAHCFPGRLNAGSYVVIWEGRNSAAAFYDACVNWDAMIALDNTLTAAVYEDGR